MMDMGNFHCCMVAVRIQRIHVSHGSMLCQLGPGWTEHKFMLMLPAESTSFSKATQVGYANRASVYYEAFRCKTPGTCKPCMHLDVAGMPKLVIGCATS